MYPNQGFPGQIPANNASQIPQLGFVTQPLPNYGQQIPNYNQPQPMNNFGQQQPIQPMANFNQQQPFPNQTQQMPNYGQQPQVNNFGQQQPFPNQAQPIPTLGQAPQTVTYPQISQQAPANYVNYGQSSQMPNYGQIPVGGQQVFLMQQTIPQIASNNIPQETVKKYRPTVVPAPNFNASADAAILRKAMKGFGTDESALISVLCHRTFEQRVEIAKAFKTSFGKDLIADIRSETSGNFEKLLVSLCMSKLEFYCSELFRSMDGLGTDEDVLIDVMCTLSNKDIKEVTEMFERKHKKSLESFLRGDTSGYFKRLMTSLSAGNRDESTKTDINAAQQDARALKTAGVDKWGTDESEFIRVLCSRNYEQIKLICQEYQKIAGKTLEHDIKKEFSGDIQEGLLAIVQYANSPPEFFARRLHKSMVGLGTNDRTLIRLCVGRCEIDMEDVKDAFLRLYGKTLKSFIKGDTSGDYKNALFALCGER